MTKNEAIELAIKLIREDKLEYYIRQGSYLSEYGKKKYDDIKQAIAILEGLKDDTKPR